MIIAETFGEACVNFNKTDVPSAFILLFTTVKRVIVLFRYCILKAAFRILFNVKLKEFDEMLDEGWI